MEKREIVSIIVPVYNVERYLNQCIDSVLHQTYQEFELILVDDGSTDSSRDICKTYAEGDARIQLICQENGGQSKARNTGYKLAKGKYVYFLDSDDWIEVDALEHLVRIADSKEADIVFFDGEAFLDDARITDLKQTYKREHIYNLDTGYNLLEKLQRNDEFRYAIPLLFLKKEYMDEIGISFEEGVIYEDMIFAYELFVKAKKVMQCKETLYHRRYRANSTMTSVKTKGNFLSAKKVYSKIQDISIELNLLKDATAMRYIARCAFNTLNCYTALSRAERKACRDDFVSIKKAILTDDAYGDRALYYRCYGRAPWAIYKLYEKAIIGLKGK